MGLLLKGLEYEWGLRCRLAGQPLVLEMKLVIEGEPRSGCWTAF
jgi:hypothetical protein